MNNDSKTFYIKKNRRLTQVLFVSGALNISVLAFFSYWVARERPPTPYCEMKPASADQQQIPLADQRGLMEVIADLQNLPFNTLLMKLNSINLIENGFTERDLALSTLIAFHYFDVSKALTYEPKEKRLLKWPSPMTNGWIPIYPGLTDKQFDSIVAFAKTEKWPQTTQGLFSLLQKQEEEKNVDPSLVETFLLTPEFLTIELIFKHTQVPISNQKFLKMILEGNWDYFKTFAEQQRQINDLSAARRQKILLDYVKLESQEAAYLLLELEEEFVVKKLDDAQIIAILQLLPEKTKESEKFSLTLLTSPRSTSVWQQASLRLYEYAGEPIPKNWNYSTSLARFAPEKIKKPDPIVKKIPAPIPLIVSPKPQEKKDSTPKKIVPIKVEKPKVFTPPIQKAKTDTKKQYRSYIVQEGDSLWKISRRFGVDMEELKKQNKIKSNFIKPGTILKIP